jgi:hypothetical protein
MDSGQFSFLESETKKCWLSFTQLTDPNGCTFLYITSHQTDRVAGPHLITAAYKSIILERDFFSDRHAEFLECALSRLSTQQALPLSLVQQNEIRWIVEKVESINVCDYRFKAEYLQQLILQLIHFSLKNFSASVVLMTLSDISPMVSKQICDHLSYSLN